MYQWGEISSIQARHLPLGLTWAWCLCHSHIWSARRSSTCGRRRCSARRSSGGTPPTWGAPPPCGTVNDKAARTLNQRWQQLTDFEWLVVFLEQHRMIKHPNKQPFLMANSYFEGILATWVLLLLSKSLFYRSSRELAFTTHQVLKNSKLYIRKLLIFPQLFKYFRNIPWQVFYRELGWLSRVLWQTHTQKKSKLSHIHNWSWCLWSSMYFIGMEENSTVLSAPMPNTVIGTYTQYCYQ